MLVAKLNFYIPSYNLVNLYTPGQPKFIFDDSQSIDISDAQP